MKITDELLWEYAANKVTPEEKEFILATMQEDKSLAKEIERIQFLHTAIRSNLSENMKGVSANITSSILQKVNEFDARKIQRTDNLLLYTLFVPLLLLLAGFYMLFIKETVFRPLVTEPHVPVIVIVSLVVLLVSSIIGRYMLYRVNINRL